MDTTLRKATDDDRRLIKNLVPYYIYDMSGPMGWDPNAEGLYDGCDELPEYWKKPDHHPYVITVDGRIGGFAMVRPYPGELERTEIGELFVLRKFQGHGVGTVSAFKLFDAHPGQWLVRVLNGNTGARGFWQKVIEAYTDGRFTHSAEQYLCQHSGVWPMQFYRFESRIQPAEASAHHSAGDP
jgi:predicted acetyltransferase